YAVPNGVFSMWVNRNGQKLGLMRLLLNHYIEEIKRVLNTAGLAKPAVPDDLKELLLAGGSENGVLMARREP
ncbi:MAG: hypothetical protein ACFFD9_00530, partial [Candidatus Thorarchaeota archaeon]